MVRTPSIGSVQYAPSDAIPTDPEQLQRFLREEFLKIKAALDALASGHLDKTYAPPAKPREGNVRFADGTQWNPGSGKGVYYYNGASWVLLG